MGKNVTQINGGITVNVDVSVRDVMYMKKITFGILLHVVVKVEKQSYDKTKTILTNFNEKKATCKT